MAKTKKLYIGPLGLPNNREIDIEPGLNPGIGGSEFQLLSLAKELAHQRNLQVVVLLWPGSLKPKNSNNSRLIFEYYSETVKPNKSEVVIAPIGSLIKLPGEFTSNAFVVASSHHPHDHGIKDVQKKHRVDLVRSVGIYSHESNRIFTRQGVYLPNLFLSELKQELWKDIEDKGVLGNISSMHPSKGSHHVALLSYSVLQDYPHLKVEFVGDLSLYAKNNKPNPTLDRYQNKRIWIAMKFLRSQSIEDRVIFSGLVLSALGEHLDRWRFAIQNPLGIGEADPASVKDCLSRGVPVFSSGFFGMWDYMRLFPETRAFWPSTLRKKMTRISSDEIFEHNLRDKCQSLATRLEHRNREIIKGWVDLIFEGESSQATIKSSLYPSDVSLTSKVIIWGVSTLLYFKKISHIFFGAADRFYSVILRADHFIYSWRKSHISNKHRT